MTDENRNKYFYLVIGYAGLLLVGLGGLRYSIVLDDSFGYAITFMGYLCLAGYIRFADNKIGVTKKEKIIFRTGFVVVLVVVSLLMMP
ncbi:hypothetical protein VBD025_16300 [Virgibacillus flavescens]|uniref:hypothetical protein n=1 Tax=Virgibacillus flavescens TaxID=1611422 RepID=UPI003D336C83